MSTIKGSEIIDIFENDASYPTIGSWMFDFCYSRKRVNLGPIFFDSLNYSYTKITDSHGTKENKEPIHSFSVECVHGYLSRKQIANILLQFSKSPDTVIAIELEHSIKSIHKRCELCRSK